jgi:hypothetical protein
MESIIGLGWMCIPLKQTETKTQHEAGRQPPEHLPPRPPCSAGRIMASIFRVLARIPGDSFENPAEASKKSTRVTFFSLEKGSNFV